MAALKVVTRTAFAVAVYGLLLFLPAGTLDWWRAWVLLAFVFAGMVVTRVWVFHADSALLEERRKSPLQKGQPRADKILVIAFVLVFPAYIAFVPLDVFRFHLLGKPDDVVAALGLMLFIAGWWTITLAFRENTFASAIVKPQAERGQTVIDTGVYRIVRHPLYSGVVLLIIGLALWLQSYAALACSIIPLAVVVARILVEEDFLRQQLLGYDAYTKRVRRRLIPGIW